MTPAGYAPGIAGHLDDADLVASAQAGDRHALDVLLRRHYDRIHRICRRIAGPSRDADDACQEAMIKIVRNLPRFDGRSAFGTWAYRVATNAALDEVRKRSRRPALRMIGDDAGPEVRDPDAERTLSSVDDRDRLDAALATLPEEFRAAVVLRDVADLDYAEIADVLEVQPGTVKSRIARGRRLLADELRRTRSTATRPAGNQRRPSQRPTDPKPSDPKPSDPPSPDPT